MRNLWLAAGAAVVLAAAAANANPLDDAKAGMQAYDKGDNPAAVRLFTSAINSHRLLRSDQELAYVKRAQAHIALGQGQAALADSYSALNLDPADSEAIATRDRAQAMLNPPPAVADAAPPEPSAYLKSQNAYQEALKRYEDQKSADTKHYDEQLAKYNAELKAQEAARQATAETPKPKVEATAETTKPKVEASKPTVEAAAQPAPKPVVKAAPKAARKPTAPPDEFPHSL
jgi:tetratricopeptide (TPR) repeat protein